VQLKKQRMEGWTYAKKSKKARRADRWNVKARECCAIFMGCRRFGRVVRDAIEGEERAWKKFLRCGGGGG